MLYTDQTHLVADSLPELHEYAENIGLRRHYFEGIRKGHPHYDLKTAAGNWVRDITGDKIIDKVLLNENVKIITDRELLVISKSMKNGGS